MDQKFVEKMKETIGFLTINLKDLEMQIIQFKTLLDIQIVLSDVVKACIKKDILPKDFNSQGILLSDELKEKMRIAKSKDQP